MRTTLAAAWPGTILSGHSAKLYVVRFDEEVKDRMCRAQNRLEKWTHWNSPPLPEDPCVYREGDDLPTLVSVTHERWGWILHDGVVPASLATRADFPSSELIMPPPPDFLSRLYPARAPG